MSVDVVPSKSGGSDSVVYVYGVARSDMATMGIAPPAEGIVPGVPVELLPIGDLAVLASRATKDTFAPPETTEKNAQVWATDRALAHHQVLSSMASLCAVAPVKFGALCRSLDDILELFAQHGSEFAQVLERVAGAQEWGIKLFANRTAFHDAAENAAPISALKVEIKDASPGRAYFLRKKLDSAIGDEMLSSLSNLAESVHNQISAFSREATAKLGTPHSRQSQTLILDAAYLVAKERYSEFSKSVSKFSSTLAAQGVELKLTGPWPPYSFASVNTGG